MAEGKKLITEDSSLRIYQDRYEYNKEGIKGTLKRVAKHIARSEDEFDEFYNVMENGYFLPAGRTITNSGIGKKLTLNNCFNSNHVPDSIDGIFERVKLGALTHKAGGGIGYDFSLIRPSGSPTSNEAVASGVTSFAHVFDAQTKTILQGQRRGANMGVLNIYHPDIYDYLNAKSFDEGSLTQFNLSIMVDNEFMHAVENDENVFLHFPVYDNNSRILKDMSKWTHSKEIRAKDLWDLIIQKAYDTGEYGVLYYDNMNDDNPTQYLESIVTTNPCGEYTSGVITEEAEKRFNIKSEDYMGACNLGSIHLHRLVKNPFTKDVEINYEELKSTVRVAVKFLDAIIDINVFPHKAYENYQLSLRTIGLGITGLHNVFSMFGYQYGDTDSVLFTEDLMNIIAKEAFLASIDLAKEKGAFPLLDKDLYLNSGYLKKHIENDGWEDVADGIKKYGIRNARIMSVAPVGTMSLTFGDNCSSGLEPTFMNEIDRTVRIGGQSDEHKKVIKVRDYAYKLWLENNPSKSLSDYPYKCAMELDVEQHLSILNAVAYHVDMSVSKTINIPTDYSFDKTKEVYLTTWKNKNKGCTIFRPNPLRQGIFNATVEQEVEPVKEIPRGYIIESSDDLIGRKTKIQTGCGSLHISVFFDESTGEPMEVYFNKGGTGGCLGYMGGMSRMISLALRGGVHYTDVLEQLKSVHSCPSYVVRTKTKGDTDKGNNCSGAIGFAIEELVKEMKYDLGLLDDITTPKKVVIVNKDEKVEDEHVWTCPECGAKTVGFSGGCAFCASCGHSKCS